MSPAPLSTITAALVRLDTRRHGEPARLELSFDGESREWVAVIMAYPLRTLMVAAGDTPELALAALAVKAERIDWRRVSR